MKNSNTAVIIGTFDGLHRGHQFLLRSSLEKAKELNTELYALTYTDHPLFELQGKVSNYLLENNQTRLDRLKDILPFKTLEFPSIKNMEAKEFFGRLLELDPNLRYVFVGHDSSFGKDKVSCVSLLNSYFEELHFIQIEKYIEEDVSSTLLRNLIKSGDFLKYKELTLRDYILSGKVERGKQLGRTLGFPTANLAVDERVLLPPNAVYEGKVEINGNSYKAVANIGRRPTVDKDEIITVEIHILNFNKDIYGEELCFNFLRKIRDIKKFSSKDELVEQIAKDVQSCYEL